MQIDLDDDIVALLRQANQSADRAAREMIALELFRRGTISSGKAAQILGMGRLEFIQHAGQLGIPYFNMSSDEWAAEMESVRRLSQVTPKRS
ncbi:MAG: UPF0175 family protein [Tepidisphaeraceae bacterium]